MSLKTYQLTSIFALMIFWWGIPPSHIKAQVVESANSKQNVHVVTKGESLFHIAQTHGTSVQLLREYNKITDNKIYIGQSLLLTPPTSSSASSITRGEQSNANTESVVGKGTLYVVAIGISSYEDPTLPKLPHAKADAEAVCQAYSTQAEGLYEKVVLYEITKSTFKDTIISTLFKVANEAKPQDMILIYIAAHAQTDSINKSLFILPTDYNGEVQEQQFPIIDLLRVTNRAKCAKILTLDVCYARNATADFSDIIKYFGTSFVSNVALIVGSNQEGYELDSLGHGIMTFSFLNAIKGKADLLHPDGYVFVQEMLGYLSSDVYFLSSKKQQAHMPINWLGDIPIFKYKDLPPKPDPSKVVWIRK